MRIVGTLLALFSSAGHRRAVLTRRLAGMADGCYNGAQGSCCEHGHGAHGPFGMLCGVLYLVLGTMAAVVLRWLLDGVAEPGLRKADVQRRGTLWRG